MDWRMEVIWVKKGEKTRWCTLGTLGVTKSICPSSTKKTIPCSLLFWNMAAVDEMGGEPAWYPSCPPACRSLCRSRGVMGGMAAWLSVTPSPGNPLGITAAFIGMNSQSIPTEWVECVVWAGRKQIAFEGAVLPRACEVAWRGLAHGFPHRVWDACAVVWPCPLPPFLPSPQVYKPLLSTGVILLGLLALRWWVGVGCALLLVDVWSSGAHGPAHCFTDT